VLLDSGNKNKQVQSNLYNGQLQTMQNTKLQGYSAWPIPRIL